MRFLFVYGGLHTGGTQTMIVRLSNHLAALGHDVAICYENGVLAQQAGSKVTLIVHSGVSTAAAACESWLCASAEQLALLSFDPISAAEGLLIETRTHSKAPISHVSAVHHPRAYFMDGERADRKLLNSFVARGVGFDRLYFVNEECRTEHARRWRVDLSESPIIPIAVAARPRSWQPTGAAELRVLSVGRLVDFKRYNLGIPTIVRAALDARLAVSWDIFGSGPLRPEIEREIEREGVADVVSLRGELPYAQLTSTFLGYDLFVGMGTAAIEAAMVGLPAIAATDGEKNHSYGFFHDLPFGNVGERQAPTVPMARILDLMSDYAARDRAARLEMSERGHKAAMRFALPEIAVKTADLARDAPPAPSGRRKYLTASLYCALTDSRLVRSARALRARIH